MALTMACLFGSSTIAAGLNTGTFYRYPWQDGAYKIRTQGQFGSDTHTEARRLQWAVDWDLGTDNWPVFAASAGTVTCYLQGEQNTSTGFGNWLAVYNAVANETAIYAHKDNCFPFTPDQPYTTGQGQYLGVAGQLGCVDPLPVPYVDVCIHLHFQVDDGDNQVGTLVSKPFSMSDMAADPNNSDQSFPDSGRWASDGPSDNAGTAYYSQNPISADWNIAAAYLSYGGASGSWWNVGAPYRTGVGPCIYSNNAFVHTCNTLYGPFTVQDYVRWDGLPSAVARNASGSAAYRIAGVNWMLTGTSFRTNDFVTNELGPPDGAETGGSPTLQLFAGGYINHYTDRVRQDVFMAPNGTWRATYYFQSNGDTCVDADGNGNVGFGELMKLDQHYSTTEYGPPNSSGYSYTPLVDFDRNGSVGFGDLMTLSSQYGKVCQI